MKILLAVDGSKCSEAACDSVASRPWPHPSEVRILSVAEHASLMAMPDTWGPPSDFYEKLEKAARDQAKTVVDKVVAILGSRMGDGVTVTSVVMEGFPKEEILKEADRWKADLIVLGSHGYRGLKRFWLGSVSQAVATHATCSVEIIRCREAATP